MAEFAVQDVDYKTLRETLLAEGQVLQYDGPTHGEKGTSPKSLPGIVVDDAAAVLEGGWVQSGSAKDFVGNGYRHDGNVGKGTASATFSTKMEKSGRYEVRFAYPPNSNRASQVTVEIQSGDEVKKLILNQKEAPSDGVFESLGVYEISAGTTVSVKVSNAGTDGHVVIDAVQWIEAK
jgi:hypothetical protein